MVVTNLRELYEALFKLGLDPSALQTVVNQQVIVNYWAYQDFTVSPASNTVTLTTNENQDTPAGPISVQDGTAVLTTQTGNPYGTFLTRKKVQSHTGTSVTFDGNVSGDIRVWWLQKGVIPYGMNIAPKFVRESIAAYFDDEYVNQVGNETISGVKTFANFPELPITDPSTDYQAAHRKWVLQQITGSLPTGNTPPSSPSDGAVWIKQDDAMLYVYDADRNVWLTDEFVIQAGRNSATMANSYMRGINGTPHNLSPLLFGKDVMMTRVEIISEAADADWDLQFRLNGATSGSPTQTVTAADRDLLITPDQKYDTDDKITLYVATTSTNTVSRPTVIMHFAYRLDPP